MVGARERAAKTEKRDTRWSALAFPTPTRRHWALAPPLPPPPARRGRKRGGAFESAAAPLPGGRAARRAARWTPQPPGAGGNRREKGGREGRRGVRAGTGSAPPTAAARPQKSPMPARAAWASSSIVRAQTHTERAAPAHARQIPPAVNTFPGKSRRNEPQDRGRSPFPQTHAALQHPLIPRLPPPAPSINKPTTPAPPPTRRTRVARAVATPSGCSRHSTKSRAAASSLAASPSSAASPLAASTTVCICGAAAVSAASGSPPASDVAEDGGDGGGDGGAREPGRWAPPRCAV